MCFDLSMTTVRDGKHSSAKKHIGIIVEAYKKLYPADYAIVVEGIKMQKYFHDDEFASAKLQGAAYTRALFEIPVELHEMLIQNLSEDDMAWFKAGGKDRKEGALWFAKKFREFAVPKTI